MPNKFMTWHSTCGAGHNLVRTATHEEIGREMEDEISRRVFVMTPCQHCGGVLHLVRWFVKEQAITSTVVADADVKPPKAWLKRAHTGSFYPLYKDGTGTGPVVFPMFDERGRRTP
jgi:hypothetical protein